MPEPTAQGTDQAAEIPIGRLTLRNPVICSSGESVMTGVAIAAALKTGVAGVVAKSINENPGAAEQLDRADYVALDTELNVTPWTGRLPPDVSLLCRSGLAQVEAASWMEELGRLDLLARETGQFVAGSVVMSGIDGCLAIVELAERAGLRVFEVNIGAPHASEAQAGAINVEREEDRVHDLVSRIRQATDMHLWVKLTGDNVDLAGLTAAVKSAGGEAVSLTTRFMAMLPDPETMKPVLGTAAAYGGRWALPITCRRLAHVRKSVGPDFPLIATNGARSGLDAVRMMLAGASAVEMASVSMTSGFDALTNACAELHAYLARKGVAAAEIVGRAADSMASYQEQPRIPGHWKKFTPVP